MSRLLIESFFNSSDVVMEHFEQELFGLPAICWVRSAIKMAEGCPCIWLVARLNLFTHEYVSGNNKAIKKKKHLAGFLVYLPAPTRYVYMAV